MSKAATIVKWTAIGVLLLSAATYIGDYLFVRLRMAFPKGGEAFGTVTMERLYAIPQKNGKVEYEFDARQPELAVPCVHSLLPHMGNSPCWYLQRNSQKPIPM
jgi:hypothetical protein